MTDALRVQGFTVRFRPHPIAVQREERFCPAGASLSTARLLAEDLEHAARCVTFNSTSGVEAVMAGVPTVTMDEGAMAWPVTSHHPLDPIVQPDRTRWAHHLAWTQWTMQEIRDGLAWAALATVMDPVTA